MAADERMVLKYNDLRESSRAAANLKVRDWEGSVLLNQRAWATFRR